MAPVEAPVNVRARMRVLRELALYLGNVDQAVKCVFSQDECRATGFEHKCMQEVVGAPDTRTQGWAASEIHEITMDAEDVDCNRGRVIDAQQAVLNHVRQMAALVLEREQWWLEDAEGGHHMLQLFEVLSQEVADLSLGKCALLAV